MNDDHIVDSNKMATPRTDAVRYYLRTRDDFTETDGEVWYRFGTILERELSAANVRLAELEQWIRSLDAIEANPTEHRRWCGEIGWLYPSQCVQDAPEMAAWKRKHGIADNPAEPLNRDELRMRHPVGC